MHFIHKKLFVCCSWKYFIALINLAVCKYSCMIKHQSSMTLISWPFELTRTRGIQTRACRQWGSKWGQDPREGHAWHQGSNSGKVKRQHPQSCNVTRDQGRGGSGENLIQPHFIQLLCIACCLTAWGDQGFYTECSSAGGWRRERRGDTPRSAPMGGQRFPAWPPEQGGHLAAAAVTPRWHHFTEWWCVTVGWASCSRG